MRTQTVMAKAENFIRNETQYHLGFLPVEGANPRTVHMDRTFANSIQDGVSMLLDVDRDLLGVMGKSLSDIRFTQMAEAMYSSLSQRKRIIFSGCGATGRLSIMLEAAYRNYFRHLQTNCPNTYEKVSDLSESVGSIMTGGDYALIRSVEFFEDYDVIGREQVIESQIKNGDTLIAITATGETTSILGTVMEAAERGADVFLLICVKKEIPASRLERSKKAFENPHVTVLDMPCGAMALSGSTRMQATTLEQLIAGAALGDAIRHIIWERTGSSVSEEILWNCPINYAETFRHLVDSLSQECSIESISSYIRLEESLYRKNGLVTYFADDFLLDILTDTTERSPTFMLPPFRKYDDFISSQSWSFVKNPKFPTEDAWRSCFLRDQRCLNWKHDDYERMGISALIKSGIPRVNAEELMKFRIGNETDPERYKPEHNAAVWIGDRMPGKEFRDIAGTFRNSVSMVIGKEGENADFFIPYKGGKSPLRLFEHLAMKLVLNIISTGTMARMGKVTGNWMNCLDISNKKLIDRCIRIIADQCGLPYNEACLELFISLEEIDTFSGDGIKASPAEYTIQRLKKNRV